MVDEQARTALRDALTAAIDSQEPGVLSSVGLGYTTEAVLDVLTDPDHARALLAMLGNVREGLLCEPDDAPDEWWAEGGPLEEGDSGYPATPCFVVTLRPAGETT